MNEIRPGDVVADVGAYIGLYTIALAKRAGPSGPVVAFEPDSANFVALREHIELNGVADRVQLRETAIGDSNRLVGFAASASSESAIASGDRPGNGRASVKCETLDEVLQAGDWTS